MNNDLAEQDNLHHLTTPETPWLRDAWARNTWAAYHSDLKRIAVAAGAPMGLTGEALWAWWRNHLVPMTPEGAVRLLSATEPCAPATLARRSAALAWAHRALAPEARNPIDSPYLITWLRSRRRVAAQEGQTPRRARALRPEEVDQMLKIARGRPTAIRDKAWLLMGIFGALRVSELLGLQWDQVRPERGGLLLHLGVTKGDQEGSRAALVGLPDEGGDWNPVTALTAWKSAQKSACPWIFPGLHGDSTWGRRAAHAHLKRWAQRAGLEAADQISPHSLRATFVTWSRGYEVNDALIQQTTRHKRRETLDLYYRPEQNISAGGAAELLRRIQRTQATTP
ncbi:MAG: tyrosine-type recombinase/integrase [Acidiferrobacteraceae bacterium]